MVGTETAPHAVVSVEIAFTKLFQISRDNQNYPFVCGGKVDYEQQRSHNLPL